jgi:hypothetical protein
MFNLHVGVTSIKARNRNNSKIILSFSGNKGICNLEIQVNRLFSILWDRTIHHYFPLSTAAKNSKTEDNQNFKIQDEYSHFKHVYFKRNYLCTSLDLIVKAYVRIFV